MSYMAHREGLISVSLALCPLPDTSLHWQTTDTVQYKIFVPRTMSVSWQNRSGGLCTAWCACVLHIAPPT